MDHSQSMQHQRGEVSSSYQYPKKYRGPKPILEQVHTVADLFGVGRYEALNYGQSLPSLPNGAEGWFAIPKVSAIAKKYFPAAGGREEQYCKAVQFGHDLLKKQYDFHDYCNAKIIPETLRQHLHTVHTLRVLEEKQAGDILIIPAQYGFRHRGRSVERVRKSFNEQHEFGLDSLAVCCMAMVHPERYQGRSELDTECAGDEFSPHHSRPFSMVPHYSISGGRLGYGVGDAADAYERYGAVTGFLV